MTTARKKPEERRRQIADAALKIVAQRGLSRLTSAEIAREVGVTDAALFHHFRSKEQIILAAIDRAEELLFEQLPPDRGDPLERLGEFFRQRVGAIARNPGVGRLVLSDVLAQVAPPEGVARVHAFRRRSVEFIRASLRAAHRSGSLAVGIEVPEATALVLGSLMALTQTHDLVAGDAPAEALAATVWRILELTLRRERADAAAQAGGGRRAPLSLTHNPKPRSRT